jgi:GNAT superfamily N-acetyltransferase
MENYHRIVEGLITQGIIKVACLKEDPDVILGYAIFSKTYPALHFVFVKSAWRGIGIARSLVPKETKVVTHLTKVGLSILKKNPTLVFNPFNTP